MKLKAVLRFVPILALVLVVGCGKARQKSMENNALHTSFTVKMDKGKTNRDQEQRFIRASGKFALELDRSIRGTKKANKTYESARRAAASGITGDTLDLD